MKISTILAIGLIMAQIGFVAAEPPATCADALEAARIKLTQTSEIGIGVDSALALVQLIAGGPCGFDLTTGHGLGPGLSMPTDEQVIESAIRDVEKAGDIIPCKLPGIGVGTTEVLLLGQVIWSGPGSGRWSAAEMGGSMGVDEIGIVGGKITAAHAGWITILGGVRLPSVGNYGISCILVSEQVGEQTAMVCGTVGGGPAPFAGQACYSLTTPIYGLVQKPCSVEGSQKLALLPAEIGNSAVTQADLIPPGIPAAESLLSIGHAYYTNLC